MILSRSILAVFFALSLSVLVVGTADALFPAELTLMNLLSMLVLGISILGLVAGLLFHEGLPIGDRVIESAGGKMKVIIPSAIAVGLIILFSSGLIGQLSNLVLVISVGYTVLLVVMIITDPPRRRPKEVGESGGARTDALESALEDRQDS